MFRIYKICFDKANLYCQLTSITFLQPSTNLLRNCSLYIKTPTHQSNNVQHANLIMLAIVRQYKHPYYLSYISCHQNPVWHVWHRDQDYVQPEDAYHVSAHTVLHYTMHMCWHFTSHFFTLFCFLTLSWALQSLWRIFVALLLWGHATICCDFFVRGKAWTWTSLSFLAVHRGLD